MISKYQGLDKIRNSPLPHRIKDLLETIYWRQKDYLGKDDVFGQLMDLLHGNEALLKFFNIPHSSKEGTTNDS